MARPSALEQRIAERIKFPRRLEATAFWTMLAGGLLGAGGAAVAVMNGASFPSSALLFMGAPMVVLGALLYVNKLVQNDRHGSKVVQASRFQNIDAMDSPAHRRRARTVFLSTVAGLVVTGASAVTLFLLSSSLGLTMPGLVLCTGIMLVGCMILPWVFTRPAYPTNMGAIKFLAHEHVLAKIDATQALDAVELAHVTRYEEELASMHQPEGCHRILAAVKAQTVHPRAALALQDARRLADDGRSKAVPVLSQTQKVAVQAIVLGQPKSLEV